MTLANTVAVVVVVRNDAVHLHKKKAHYSGICDPFLLLLSSLLINAANWAGMTMKMKRK